MCALKKKKTHKIIDELAEKMLTDKKKAKGSGDITEKIKITSLYSADVDRSSDI